MDIMIYSNIVYGICFDFRSFDVNGRMTPTKTIMVFKYLTRTRFL